MFNLSGKIGTHFSMDIIYLSKKLLQDGNGIECKNEGGNRNAHYLPYLLITKQLQIMDSADNYYNSVVL